MATAGLGGAERRRVHFPVFETVKTCEHADSRCGLSSDKCCWCLDKRPHSDTGRYDVYIDGRGTVNEGARWGMYCAPCKAYWMERNRESEVHYTERSEVTARRRANPFRNAFGTMQEISSDDYVSPVTSMFQRAIAWHQRVQEREAQEREAQEQERVEQNAGQAEQQEPPPIDQPLASGPVGSEPEMTLDRQERPLPLSSEDLVMSNECKVCFSQVADTGSSTPAVYLSNDPVFLPCAHLAVCGWCADEIAPMPARNRPLAHSGKLCPICRQLIKKKLKVYRV